jgi:hypothetical protein
MVLIHILPTAMQSAFSYTQAVSTSIPFPPNAMKEFNSLARLSNPKKIMQEALKMES